MSHDSLSEDLFEVLWHHEIQKIDEISLSNFSKNLFWRGNMDPIWPKITQSYITSTALEISETF